MPNVIDVVLPPSTAQTVDVVTGGITTVAQNTPNVAVSLVGPPGQTGLSGVGGGFTFVQATPAGSVAISHTLGRLPLVAIYVAGELVEADVTADTAFVYIAFADPAAFTAVLT